MDKGHKYKSHQYTVIMTRAQSTDNIYNMYKIMHQRRQVTIYVKFIVVQ